MSTTEVTEENVYDAKDDEFYASVNWENIKYNPIPKEKYLSIKARNSKVYATFLGPNEAPAFYMFKPLKWGTYKDIRSKGLDKDSINEYVINSCVLWPKMDPITLMDEDAGILLTLVFQIFGVSNFLSDPLKSMELLYELS
jgi:hypothetical protein